MNWSLIQFFELLDGNVGTKSAIIGRHCDIRSNKLNIAREDLKGVEGAHITMNCSWGIGGGGGGVVMT